MKSKTTVMWCCILVGLLLMYVAGYGPAKVLWIDRVNSDYAASGDTSMDDGNCILFYDVPTVYMPLEAAGNVCSLLSEFLDWYWDLWYVLLHSEESNDIGL